MIIIFSIESYENEIRKNLTNHTMDLIKELKKIFSCTIYSEVELLDFSAFMQPCTLDIMVYSMNRQADEVFNEEDNNSLFSGSKDIVEGLEYFHIDEGLEDLFWEFYEENDEILEELEQRAVFDWFLSCWKQARGLDFKFPSYFLFHDDIKSYDIQQVKWIEDEYKWK